MNLSRTLCERNRGAPAYRLKVGSDQIESLLSNKFREEQNKCFQGMAAVEAMHI
jgi:hypothetical protein